MKNKKPKGLELAQTVTETYYVCDGCEFLDRVKIKAVDKLPISLDPVANYCIHDENLQYLVNDERWCHGKPEKFIGRGMKIRIPEWCWRIKDV